MRKNKAARSSGNYSRAYASISRDADILANFETGTWWAAIMLGIAFGLMFFVGLL